MWSRAKALALLLIIIGGAVSIFGCASTGGGEYPIEEKLTPGVLLELEPRSGPTMEMRKTCEKGVLVTKACEGFSGRLYNDCAGYCTIGYGHLVRRSPCDGTEPNEFLAGISEPRGGQILVNDMTLAERVVMGAVSVELNDGQYAALVDFVFNVGGRNFRESTLLKVINARQYEQVPTQLRRWVMAGGKEWPGLKLRREREIELFFEGKPQPRVLPGPGEKITPVDIRVGE